MLRLGKSRRWVVYIRAIFGKASSLADGEWFLVPVEILRAYSHSITLTSHIHGIGYFRATISLLHPAYVSQAETLLGTGKLFNPNSSTQRLSSVSLMHILLFVCQILLHHSTNLSIRIEMLANGSFLIQWTTNFLCGATNRSIGCVWCQQVPVII